MIFSEHFIRSPAKTLTGIFAIYQGPQPTLKEYVDNFASSYSFTSPDLLQIIQTGATKGSGNTIRIETNPEFSGYTQGLYSVREGTATWAAFRPAGYNEEAAYNIEGFYVIQNPQQLMANFNNASLMIVPVGDMTETGVIKFNSKLLSHPDEGQEDRAIDISITVSVLS